MSYYVNEDYSIQFFDYTDEEKRFFDFTYLLIKKYPFKWHEFINIINNKVVSYLKDTTVIINLLELNVNQVEMIFSILKDYLTQKLIKKILYKKEFIIIHFFTKKMLDVLVIENLWQSLCYYYTCLELFPQADIHFRAILEQKNEREMVDLTVIIDNNIYIFNSTNVIKDINNSKYQFFYIYTLLKRGLKLDMKKTINFSFDEIIRIKNISPAFSC